MEQPLNWLIIGAGAIGTYIGGSLILHGQKVSFLELGASASEIDERGLCLNIHGQEHRILHPNIYSAIPDALDHSPYDLAVFCLKSYDTQSMLDRIRPFSNNFPPILSFQNGVENEAAIATVVGEDHVIAGTVTSSVSRRAVGDVILERDRGIGIANTHPLSPILQSIFSRSGFSVRLYSSAPAMKWSKMLTNLMANASSAILGMSPSDILRHPGLYAIEIAQLREAIKVARSQGIKFVNLPGTPVRIYAWLVNYTSPRFSRLFLSRFVGRGRGQKMPSFYIDLQSGRGQSEVDYLNGAVVRFGERLNIPTPVNRWLTLTLQQLTQNKIPVGEYSHRPTKYLDQINTYLLK